MWKTRAWIFGSVALIAFLLAVPAQSQTVVMEADHPLPVQTRSL